MTIKIGNDTMAVIRSAAKANTLGELEELMRYEMLRDALRSIIDEHRRSRERAAERKEPRQWTPSEQDLLRRGFRDGATIG